MAIEELTSLISDQTFGIWFLMIAQRRVSIIYGYTSFFVLFNYRNKAAV